MENYVSTSLKECQSLNKKALITPELFIQTVATLFMLMFSETAFMTNALYKILPSEASKKRAERIAVKRLQTAERKAKSEFKKLIKNFIPNAGDQQKMMEAFNLEIQGLIDRFE